MAELLKFKRGLQANLDSAQFAAGTIYVTTDEQAMYVDTYVTDKDGVPQEKRLRLSDIIQIESYADWQKMAPPYSKTALYYIIEQNALIKYTGDGTSHSWKQINSTSQLSANLDSLMTRMSAAENDLGSLSDGLTALTGRVTTAESEIDTLQSEMDAVEATAAKNATAIGSATDPANASGSLYARIKKNASDISSLNTDLSAAQTDIGGLNERLTAAENINTTQTTNITNLRNDLGQSTDSSAATSAFGRIKKLEETDTAHDSRLTTVEGKVTSQGTSISQNAIDISTNADNIAKNAGDISTLKSKVSSLEGRMDAAESEIDTLQSDVSTLQTDLSAAGKEISSIKTTVSGLSEDVGALSGKVDDLENQVDQNTTDIGTNASAITALQGRATTIETNVTAVTTQANTNKTNIANLTTRVSSLETDVGDLVANAATKTELSDAIDDLNETIDNRISAANAMTYVGGVSRFSELPTTNVKIGDTYIALSGFTENGISYYAGDLIVAKGTETNGVITSNLSWDRVETGYIDEHESTLDADNGAIRLTSFNALVGDEGNLGTITVQAKKGTSATVEVSNNTITIGMEWDSFDP